MPLRTISPWFGYWPRNRQDKALLASQQVCRISSTAFVIIPKLSDNLTSRFSKLIGTGISVMRYFIGIGKRHVHIAEIRNIKYLVGTRDAHENARNNDKDQTPNSSAQSQVS